MAFLLVLTVDPYRACRSRGPARRYASAAAIAAEGRQALAASLRGDDGGIQGELFNEVTRGVFNDVPPY